MPLTKEEERPFTLSVPKPSLPQPVTWTHIRHIGGGGASSDNDLLPFPTAFSGAVIVSPPPVFPSAEVLQIGSIAIFPPPDAAPH